MPIIEPCSHLDGGRLEVELLLDDYLGIAEAVMRCPVCSQHYLIELLDIGSSGRAYRLAPLDHTAATQLVHDLTRGSCDAQRASAEVLAVKVMHPLSLYMLIAQRGSFDGLALQQCENPLPTSSWRDLPLDGQWLTGWEG